MIVDGYVRVSRVGGREGERFISPELQREQIETWCKLRKATIGEWHTDLDMSGAKADRPGLLAALERVEQGHSKGIVVSKIDRLARSLPVAFDAIQRIEAAGGMLVSVDDGIDPTTSTGKMTRNLLLVIAQWYRDQITESWDAARQKAVSRGAVIASTVPTGYAREPNGTLVPHPQWAPIIREVFRKRAGGDQWVDLAAYMNEHRVPVQYASGKDRSQGRWTGAVVSKLVQGRVYLGEARHGAYANTSAHEPLVTAALWHAANNTRGVWKPTGDKDPSLLAGIVRCSGCGYGMYRNFGRGPAGTKVTSYRCRGGGSGGVCPDRGFADAETLEQMVVAAFLDRLGKIEAEALGDTGDLELALEEVAEAEEALTVFRDDPRIIATLGAESFAEGLVKRQERVAAAHRDVQSARAPLAAVPQGVDLRTGWERADIHQRRVLLTAGIDCVVVSGRRELVPERVRICWAGLGPTDVPQRGRRGSSMRPIPLDGLPDETRI